MTAPLLALLATNLIGPVINSRAMATIESAGNVRAVGKLGERGLFQFRRAAWKEASCGLPYALAFDPDHALRSFTSYACQLAARFKADTSRWPSAQEFYCMYNIGPTRFKRQYKYDTNKVPTSVLHRANLYARLANQDMANRRRSSLAQNKSSLSGVQPSTKR
jgi:hypothetical protein